MYICENKIITKLFDDKFIPMCFNASSLTVTRSTVNVFKKCNFINPRREATKCIDVCIYNYVCPELEAILDLRKRRPKPLRRCSLFERRPRLVVPKRRSTIDS